MSKILDSDDRIALLKHYQIGVSEGHLRDGTAIVIAGSSEVDAQRIITARIGADSAQRLCPVNDFLAEGLIAELGNSHLSSKPQLSRAIAHLVVKLSKMYVESNLVEFSATATIEGDHYEVLPKSVHIVASHDTAVPHRLSPHAHDSGGMQPPRHSQT